MEEINIQNSKLQEIHHALFEQKQIKVYIKRDDLIHRLVSGNKWRKLVYNILNLKEQKKEQMLTFGGAYSNHILATAAACHLHQIKAIGIIRGDELNSSSNQMLKKCAELGMQLEFVSREEYQQRYDYDYLKELKSLYSNIYVIPEGGANFHGMLGCQDIWNEFEIPVNHVFLALGTGTTTCGLLLGNKNNAQVNAVPVLKNFDAKKEVHQLFKKALFEEDFVDELLENLTIHADYHFGGYGKHSPDLIERIKAYQNEFALPLDQVYTGKAFCAFMDFIKKTNFTPNETLVFLHTGGLSGRVDELRK